MSKTAAQLGELALTQLHKPRKTSEVFLHLWRNSESVKGRGGYKSQSCCSWNKVTKPFQYFPLFLWVSRTTLGFEKIKNK